MYVGRLKIRGPRGMSGSILVTVWDNERRAYQMEVHGLVNWCSACFILHFRRSFHTEYVRRATT